MLHGCTIGHDSLIGMGAILLNGANIGARSIVGAGAVVTEGKTFPDGSLVIGAPARVVREVDESAFQLITWSAEYYVNNSRRYASGLKQLKS